MLTTPDVTTPAKPSHLFAMSYLATHSRGLPKVGLPLSHEPHPSCHFCAHSAPEQFPRYTVTQRWYPPSFTDWNRMVDLDSHTICAACVYALKFGLKGWVLTRTQARTLKPSSPEWANLFISPPDPPFAFILNCVHLKKGRLTADGAKPRHLLLSGHLAQNRDEFPVTYGIHASTWIRASDTRDLMNHWRSIIQIGAADGLWTAPQIPKFLTAISARWLIDQPLPASWPSALHNHFHNSPRPLLSSRLVLEFVVRRALIAEFAANPPIVTVSQPTRRTKKGASR